jgi:hypothetical protein
MSIVFISDFDMRASLGRGDVGCFHFEVCCLFPGSYWKHHASPPVIIFDKELFVNWRERPEHTSTHRCLSFILATRCRNTRLISATTFTQLALMCWNCNSCKLKHAQTRLYYDQVARLPSQRSVKSFRELYSHIMYTVYWKVSGLNR